MTVYTEEAATKEECLSKIYKRHDREQVNIIRIHELTRGGVFGLFKKEIVEITYSFNPPIPSAQPKKQYVLDSPVTGSGRLPEKKIYPGYQGANSFPYPKSSSFDENRMKILSSVMESNPEIKQKLSSVVESSPPASPSKVSMASSKPAVQLDLIPESGLEPPEKNGEKQTVNVSNTETSVKDNMGSVLQAIRKIEQRLDMDEAFDKQHNGEHKNITKIMDLLEKNDFSPSFTNGIISRIRSEFTVEKLSDFDALQNKVVSWIGEAIKIAPEHSVMRPHIITLVGPTGVGKTTTVAKLAAAYIRAYKKAPRPLNVRVITIDNYRIGAKQHLEKYGEIMGVTVSSAETPSDLQKLVACYQDADIILIDTTGRSPRDYVEIAKMRTFFDGIHNSCETLLTVSACTKASDLRDIIRQYETFTCDGIVVTKFDETTRIGNIVSVLAGSGLPVAYITTGQRVPKDFEPATVIKFLLALDGFSIDRFKLEEEFPVPENRFEWS